MMRTRREQRDRARDGNVSVQKKKKKIRGRKCNFLPEDTAWHASPNRHTYNSLLALWSQWGSGVTPGEYKYCHSMHTSGFISFVVFSVL